MELLTGYSFLNFVRRQKLTLLLSREGTKMKLLKKILGFYFGVLRKLSAGHHLKKVQCIVLVLFSLL